MTYAITNTTNILTVFTNVDSASGGWLGNLILLVLWAVVFISLKSDTSPARAGAAASFLTFIISSGLVFAGITSIYVCVISLALSIGLGLASYFEDKG